MGPVGLIAGEPVWPAAFSLPKPLLPRLLPPLVLLRLQLLLNLEPGVLLLAESATPVTMELMWRSLGAGWCRAEERQQEGLGRDWRRVCTCLRWRCIQDNYWLMPSSFVCFI